MAATDPSAGAAHAAAAILGGRRTAVQRTLVFLERYGVLVAFVALFLWSALFAESAETFRRPENLRNILNQNAATGIVAVGMTLVIVAGGIDLSVGSIMGLAGAVGIVVMNRCIASETSELTAVLCGGGVGLLIGLACGATNGLLVTLGRLPAFIATLGGLSAYRSITLALADGGELRAGATDVLTAIGRGGVPIVPGWLMASGEPLVFYWNIVLFLVVAIAGQVVLGMTRYGRHVVAVGGNETAARYSAIAVERVRFAAYVIIGVLASVAGLMLTARNNSMSASQLGVSMELDAIAAVVIGDTSMSGGKGRVWGTVLGVLILAIINNMLVVAEVSPYWQGCVKGVIILLAVLIQRGRR